MRSLARRLRALLPTVLALVGLIALAGQPSWAQGQGQTLNYRDADIRAFINDVALTTGRTFIVDPSVKGQVTVVSSVPVDAASLLEIFNATLRVNGFTTVPTGSGATKIVPLAAAVGDTTPVGNGVDGDRLITEVIRLRNVTPEAASNVVRPLVPQPGQVIAHRGTRFITVVDFAANMARIREVVSRIDRDTTEIATIPLRNTVAADMVAVVNALRVASPDGEAGQTEVVAVPIDAANAVVLRGEPDQVRRMEAMIRRLDAEERVQNDVRVIRLKHARAADLVPLLQQVSRSLLPPTAADAPPAAGPLAAEVSIAAHEPTNAIVINAGPDMQRALAQVVAELDVRRPQVLVEAIIVEISDTAARNLGLQYILSGDGNNRIPFTATNFSSAAPNLLASLGAILVPEDTGVSDTLREAAVNSLLGLNGFAGGVAGRSSNGTLFGVIVNALKQDTDSNILSTPSLLVLDNEDANLLVGQEIPITTGEQLGDNFENPFRTISRQDVGIKLEVTPQINEGDTIQLLIRQEASSILGPITETSTDLILNNRELSTTVVVDDGEIVVLGGLIQQDEQFRVDKVPLLGEIPVLGNLFKSESKSNVRTNLMIFLRPTIVRSPEDARGITQRKFDVVKDNPNRRGGTTGDDLDRLVDEVLGGTPQPSPRPRVIPTEPQP